MFAVKLVISIKLRMFNEYTHIPTCKNWFMLWQTFIMDLANKISLTG